MTNFEEIKILLEVVETAAAKRAEARQNSAADEAAAASARATADDSNNAAVQAQQDLAVAVQAVNNALGAIVAGDDVPAKPQPAARPGPARANVQRLTR